MDKKYVIKSSNGTYMRKLTHQGFPIYGATVDEAERFDSQDEALQVMRGHVFAFATSDIEELQQERKCRVCGCTQLRACITDDGPCHWVEDDLCCACVDKEDSHVH